MKRSFCVLPARRQTMLLPALAVAVMAIAIGGCGRGHARPAVQPVEGQVVWNGKPLAEAVVTFYRQGESEAAVRAPRARTDAEGRFHLGTFAGDDGAPEGEYTVGVVHFPMEKRGGDLVEGLNDLPKKYAKPATSSLHVKVENGPNTLPALVLEP